CFRWRCIRAGISPLSRVQQIAVAGCATVGTSATTTEGMGAHSLVYHCGHFSHKTITGILWFPPCRNWNCSLRFCACCRSACFPVTHHCSAGCCSTKSWLVREETTALALLQLLASTRAMEMVVNLIFDP